MDARKGVQDPQESVTAEEGDKSGRAGHITARLQAPEGKQTALRQKVGGMIESWWMDMLIIILTLLDVGCVAMESAVDLHLVCVGGTAVHMPVAEVMARVESGPEFMQEDAAFGSSLLEEGGRASTRRQAALGVLARSAKGALGQTTGRLQDGSVWLQQRKEEAGALICEDREGPQARRLVHAAHNLSIFILMIFLCELLVKIWLHPGGFFRNSFHILDLVVVTVSLICDAILEPLLEQSESFDLMVLTAFLVIFRFWRVVRMAHGVFEVVHEEAEYIEELKLDRERLEEKCRALEAEAVSKSASQ